MHETLEDVDHYGTTPAVTPEMTLVAAVQRSFERGTDG